MSKKNSRNIISIGFIDLLTGFLCSTAVLMIIIKYGASLGGDIAGGPKEFFYYSAVIEFENAQDDEVFDLQDVMVQLMIKTPGGEWIESEIQKAGMVYESGFVNFNNPDFYGLGPSFLVGDRSPKLYYHVYGTSEIDDKDSWQVGLRYYTNKQLEEGWTEITDEKLKDLASTQIKVTHRIEHILSEEEVDPLEDMLSLGEDSFITIKIEDGGQ